MTQTGSGDVSIANQLRSILRSRGMSGRTLAEKVGMSPPTLARTLRGERTLTIDELQAIAHVLDVNAADLLAGRAGVAS